MRARGARNRAWIELKPGDRFGRYTLVQLDHVNACGQWWLARCDCGTERVKCCAQMRLDVKKNKPPQCLRCGRAQRSASGAATRAGLAAMAANVGDVRAFALRDPVSIDDDLPRPWLDDV